ncbi:calcium-binding mitochondrial carrier protein SCaMC-1-B-like [Astyanax mexicanus]|uniref:Calcium-binding mitochondrial carrier protein SCaMC-1-B-like n=1 Tax=Astyanax mexicanus TaxID=7994 RepID=A0A8B9LRF6_ASTMX|nr:calcium-binding mitochondrial carrier protein SCaMC-1-B-like [Astyanax mexicanus]
MNGGSRGSGADAGADADAAALLADCSCSCECGSVDQEVMEQFESLFCKLDRNRDGFISVEELQEEMRRVGVVCGEEKARIIVSNSDRDQDGRLNYEEFLNYIMDQEKKWKIDFQNLDKNNRGVIDQEDIVNVFKELGVVISKQSAKRIIQMMDEDSSMTVDWGEFLQHVIINPAENIRELISSWKHTLVFDVGESRSMPIELTQGETDLSEWRNFILAAGLSDAVSRTVTAPIDRLKTQLQVYGSKAVSLGLQDLRTGGLRSMWQGNAVNVLKGTPQSTLQCFLYTQMRKQTLGERDHLSVEQRFGLGCVSGAVAHAAFYPLEVLKVRLNLQQAGNYSGLLGCAKSIYSNESVTAFYRGFRPSLLCMIPYAGVECAVHQSIMSWARRNPANRSDIKLLFFSFVAFACGQASSYPLAVIRTQHQAQAFTSNCQKSSHIFHGLVGIYEKNGLRGFYSGMGASFVRAVPCALLNYTLISKLEELLSTHL